MLCLRFFAISFDIHGIYMYFYLLSVLLFLHSGPCPDLFSTTVFANFGRHHWTPIFVLEIISHIEFPILVILRSHRFYYFWKAQASWRLWFGNIVLSTCFSRKTGKRMLSAGRGLNYRKTRVGFCIMTMLQLTRHFLPAAI